MNFNEMQILPFMNLPVHELPAIKNHELYCREVHELYCKKFMNFIAEKFMNFHFHEFIVHELLQKLLMFMNLKAE